jgi:hypothetical protein
MLFRHLGLGALLVPLALAACADTPTSLPPNAPATSVRASVATTASTIIDGFTITLFGEAQGDDIFQNQFLPRRILDDGTVYGIVDNPTDPSFTNFRWTPEGGVKSVASIPPPIAGDIRLLDPDGFPGTYFYSDGAVDYRTGRQCGAVDPVDPEDPDFCDYESAVGTFVTSSCTDNQPEQGIFSAGLAVNRHCHVLAMRRPRPGTSGAYLWRPETGWLHLFDEPVHTDLSSAAGFALVNGADQVVALAQMPDQPTGDINPMFWRPDLGARPLPLPATPGGSRVSAAVYAMNEGGQMVGVVEGGDAGVGTVFTAVAVWTPPPGSGAGAPAVNASPLKGAVTTTFLGKRKGFYTQFYSLTQSPRTPPYRIRTDWGDGTATQRTRNQIRAIEAEIHNYQRTGTFTITVTAVDANGRSASDSRTLTVLP